MGKYFKWGDLIIYTGILIILGSLITSFLTLSSDHGGKVEVYVDGKLYAIYDLVEDYRLIKIPTNLGGVELELKEGKARVISSNSPRKLIIKQGFVSKAGETLIGIPDRAFIKVVGTKDRVEEEIDAIIY